MKTFQIPLNASSRVASVSQILAVPAFVNFFKYFFARLVNIALITDIINELRCKRLH